MQVEVGEHRGVEVGSLSAVQAQEELSSLGKELLHHERLYYNDASPAISDDDYDALVQRAEAIEAGYDIICIP